MAIIITNKDCTLSEVNAFYRVEDSNLAFQPTTVGLPYLILSTARYISVTPANAGNYTGCGVALYITGGDRSLTIDLQEGQTATLAVASPGVVGLVGHGFAVGTAVQFTTAGTLPTGVVANTVYYARNTDCATPADQFHLYSTSAYAIAGGTTGRINFTGTSTGTHTCWVVRSTESKTTETIRGGFTSPVNTTNDKLGVYLVSMKNPSVNYAVTAVAGAWRLKTYQSGGTTGSLYVWYNPSTVAYPFWFSCDTLMTFTNGDTPIFAHYCDIDQTANFNGVLGAGDTVRGTAGVICSNEVAQTVADVSYLRCEAPVASYTLTLNGIIWTAGHSGFRVGSSAVPVTVANRFILNTGAGTVGTARGGFITIYSSYSTSYYYGSRSSIFFYGEYPAKIRTSLTQDTATLTGLEGQTCTMTVANPCVVTKAAHGYVGNEPVVFSSSGALPNGGTTDIVSGTTYYVKYVNTTTFRLSATPGGADISTAGGTQSGTHYFGAKSTIVVDEDMSLQGWGAGDIIAVGKQDVQGVGSTVTMAIESILGTSITFTHILPGYRRLSGGSVINLTPSKYGVNLVDTGTNTAGYVNLFASNNQNIEGCYIKGIYFTGVSSRASDDDNNTNLQTQTLKNSVCEPNGTLALYVLYKMRLPRLGLTIDNVWGWRTIPEYGSFPATATAVYKAGTFTMNNVGVLSRQAYYMGIAVKCLCNFSNIYMENGTSSENYGLVLNIGAGSTVDGVYIYGDALGGAGSYGAVVITAVSINSSIKNVYITNSYVGLQFTAAAVVFGLTFDNVVCSGNTYDLQVLAGAYINAVFKNCNGITRKSYSDLTDTTDGTTLSFVNYNDIANVDTSETTWGIFKRTGDSLQDTTVHTSGTGKFAIRFRNTIQGVPLVWTTSVPTGDIQNKELIIGVWCKINSANYYGGTYTKPRLTVSYDDGASNSYTEATNTTNWQYLLVSVTPITTFGQVTVMIQTDTDAGNRGYVTVDAASPCTVTYNAHGFTGGESISFETDDTIPTGIVAGRTYYVLYIDGNTFNFSETYGGTAVATTTTGTGNLTLYAQLDAYVYFDDVLIQYPTNHHIDLGSLDLWNNGMPITPSVQIGINSSNELLTPQGQQAVWLDTNDGLIQILE
jgi:hypothetical protein